MIRGNWWRKRVRIGRWAVSLGVLTGVLLGLLAVGGGVYAYLGISNGGSGSIDLQKGLVGHWKLDGNGRDSAGYSHDGTVNGAVATADRKGRTGGAMAFNGATNAVEVPNFDHGILRQANQGDSWSLAIWAKWVGTNGNERVLMGRSGCHGGIYTYGNTYAFAIKTTNCWTDSKTISATVPNITDWHHLAATYDNGQMSFYVDGVLQGAATLTATMTNYGTHLGIGSLGTYGFSGQLDDARAYDRSLSAAEVNALSAAYDSSLKIGSGQGGLVGHWKLDGDAKDATPYGNNGTITGATPAADRKGKANGAFSFDGNDSIMIPDSTAFDVGAQGMTYTAWVNPTAFPKAYNMIMGHYLPYFSVRSTRQLHFSINAGGAQRSVLSTTLLNANQWYHVAANIDSAGYMRIFINGVQDAVAGPYTGGVTNYNYNQYIGHWNGSADGYNFTGILDDLRIYNRALSANEITAQYASYESQINLNSSPSGASASTNINSGLVAYWPFNGNAKDMTPHGNNGVVNGATLTSDRKGRAGNAYLLGTSNQWINVGSPPTYSSLPNGFTYSVWLNYSGTPSSTQWPVVMGASNTHVNFAIRSSQYGQRIYFEYGLAPFAGADWGACGGYVTPANEWHLYTYTFDGSVLRYYRDGAYINFCNVPGGMAPTFGGLSFTTSSSGWNGSIDDARVYNRALTTAEVAALYQVAN